MTKVPPLPPRATLREHNFQLRLTRDELEMLHALATADGVSASDVLRTYIRRTSTERFGDRIARKRPTSRGDRP